MCAREERIRAVRLSKKHNKSRMAATNELGYSSRAQLMSWYRKYEENGDPAIRSRVRYDGAQKCIAVDLFFNHGQRLARIICKLGYPRSSEFLEC